MDASWTLALIGGAAGVLGASVGGGALLKIARDDRAERRAQEQVASLIALYAAVNRLGMLYHTWSVLQPDRDNPVTRFRFGLQISGYTKMIVARLWEATDDVWTASGRARAAATADARKVIDELEEVFADWQIGEPLPEAWVPAIRQLRALIEGHAPGDRGRRS